MNPWGIFFRIIIIDYSVLTLLPISYKIFTLDDFFTVFSLSNALVTYVDFIRNRGMAHPLSH